MFNCTTVLESCSLTSSESLIGARPSFAFIHDLAPIVSFQTSLLGQDGPAAEQVAPSFLSPLTLVAGFFFLFYFIVIAPERRKKAEEAKMMSALKKNDRVVTIGGIHAVVAAVAEGNDVVTLKIDENSNTRIKVNRSAIGRVIENEKESKSKDNDSKPETK